MNLRHELNLISMMLLICAAVVIGNIFMSYPEYYEGLSQTVPSTTQPSGVSRYAVNINEADKFELLGIDGITERMADRIIEYRKVNGRFTKVSDIRQIEGIGKVTFEKIRPYITV